MRPLRIPAKVPPSPLRASAPLLVALASVLSGCADDTDAVAPEVVFSAPQGASIYGLAEDGDAFDVLLSRGDGSPRQLVRVEAGVSRVLAEDFAERRFFPHDGVVDYVACDEAGRRDVWCDDLDDLVWLRRVHPDGTVETLARDTMFRGLTQHANGFLYGVDPKDGGRLFRIPDAGPWVPEPFAVEAQPKRVILDMAVGSESVWFSDEWCGYIDDDCTTHLARVDLAHLDAEPQIQLPEEKWVTFDELHAEADRLVFMHRGQLEALDAQTGAHWGVEDHVAHALGLRDGAAVASRSELYSAGALMILRRPLDVPTWASGRVGVAPARFGSSIVTRNALLFVTDAADGAGEVRRIAWE